MAQHKHTQVVDFSNPNADKIKSATTTNNMAQQTVLTEYQKLLAFQYKYYNFISWTPKEGDYYTSTRADLELYKIVKITDDKIFTIYCNSLINPPNISEWDKESFLTKGFGLQRMYVPDFVFKHKLK